MRQALGSPRWHHESIPCLERGQKCPGQLSWLEFGLILFGSAVDCANLCDGQEDKGYRANHRRARIGPFVPLDIRSAVQKMYAAGSIRIEIYSLENPGICSRMYASQLIWARYKFIQKEEIAGNVIKSERFKPR